VSSGTAPSRPAVAELGPPRRNRRLQAVELLPTALGAAVLFTVAYENGGYGLTSRSLLAVALWWTIIICVAFGLFPRTISRAALVVGGFLAAFAAWTLASTGWAASAEKAFEEFNRVSLYLAVFALAAAGVRRDLLARWIDGVGIGLVVTCGVGLCSRLFPHLLTARPIAVYLPYAAARLSFPVGYWNGLAMFAGLGVPFCLRWALIARRPVARALAVAATPVLSVVIYLASSRGGVVVASLGAVVFLAATERRWTTLGVLAAAGVGSALAVVFLAQRHTLVNGPLSSPIVAGQGRSAAALVLVCCALTGALVLVGDRVLGPRFRPRPLVGWAILGVALAAAIAGLALAHPVRRFDAFRQPLSAQHVQVSNFATAHLLSGNGSGRWQFWTAAIHEFTSAPLTGRGAGSYEFWWARHASFTYTLKNAHSLFLEVLGELGIIGLLLLLGAFVGGAVAALRRHRRSVGEEHVTSAALLAVFAAFAVGAGIDWIWQLTAVAAVGIATLGLLTGRATASPAAGGRLAELRARSRIALAVGVLGAAWALVGAQVIPWLAAAKVADSQAAVRRGDSRTALADALDAKRLQPWAASPYLQLALVAEERGDLSSARRWISRAVERDKDDWAVWFIASRIQRESGAPSLAARSYARAASLNPRSPLFSRAATP
jgi:O-antigen ligase